MFQATVPLEETRAYQSIFAKGEASGLEHSHNLWISKVLLISPMSLWNEPDEE